MDSFISTKTFRHNGIDYKTSCVIVPLTDDQYLIYVPYHERIPDNANIKVDYSLNFTSVIFSIFTENIIIYNDLLANEHIYISLTNGNGKIKNVGEIKKIISTHNVNIISLILLNIIVYLAYNNKTGDLYINHNNIYKLNRNNAISVFGLSCIERVDECVNDVSHNADELIDILYRMMFLERIYIEDVVTIFNIKSGDQRITSKDNGNRYIYNTLFLEHGLQIQNQHSSKGLYCYSKTNGFSIETNSFINILIVTKTLLDGKSNFHLGNSIKLCSYGIAHYIKSLIDTESLYVSDAISNNTMNNNIYNNSIINGNNTITVSGGTFNASFAPSFTQSNTSGQSQSKKILQDVVSKLKTIIANNNNNANISFKDLSYIGQNDLRTLSDLYKLDPNVIIQIITSN